MSIRLMTDILDGGALDLTLAQRFLLVILADFADDDGTCWPKVSTLAKRLNVKERQTQKHLATLQQKGYIEIVQKSKGHSSNVYRIRGVDNDTCRKVHLSKSTPVREDTPRPVREDTPPILYKEPSIEPPINTPNPSRGNDCPYDLILETFHSCCPSLPEPRGLPDHRKKVMQARWKEHNDIAIFQEAFKNIEASDFHSGRNGKWKQCNLSQINANAESCADLLWRADAAERHHTSRNLPRWRQINAGSCLHLQSPLTVTELIHRREDFRQSNNGCLSWLQRPFNQRFKQSRHSVRPCVIPQDVGLCHAPIEFAMNAAHIRLQLPHVVALCRGRV